MSRRTETAYKAGSAGEPAWHVRSPGFSGSGKCRGCVEKVHVLIRGDLSDKQPMSRQCGKLLMWQHMGDRTEVSRGHSSFVREAKGRTRNRGRHPMGSRKAKNPTGYYKAARMSIYEALHGYDRLQKAVVFHGWNSFVNRLVRTRMPGGVGRGSREASPYPIVIPIFFHFNSSVYNSEGSK